MAVDSIKSFLLFPYSLLPNSILLFSPQNYRVFVTRICRNCEENVKPLFCGYREHVR